jgi:penicillin-binding protein 1A
VALGAFEVTLMEMTAAYSVFANQGLAFTPYLIERITDADGDVLERTMPEAREVANPQSCFQLLQLLKGVCQRGTAGRAASLGLPNIAGKTGTTNDFTDGWFIGMTPRYTIGVWVGNDKKTTLGPKADGGRTALPLWMRLVESLKERGRIDPATDFDPPPNVVFTAVDYETGLRATPGSPKPILEAFVTGSQPTEEWNPRWDEVTRLPWSLQKSFYLPKTGEAPTAAEAAPQSAPPPTPAVR